MSWHLQNNLITFDTIAISELLLRKLGLFNIRSYIHQNLTRLLINTERILLRARKKHINKQARGECAMISDVNLFRFNNTPRGVSTVIMLYIQ